MSAPAGDVPKGALWSPSVATKRNQLCMERLPSTRSSSGRSRSARSNSNLAVGELPGGLSTWGLREGTPPEVSGVFDKLPQEEAHN